MENFLKSIESQLEKLVSTTSNDNTINKWKQMLLTMVKTMIQQIQGPNGEQILILWISLTMIGITIALLLIMRQRRNNTINKDSSQTNPSTFDDDHRVHVKIQYCDSCGFGERAEKSKVMLYDEFPSTEIRVTLAPDQGVTGNFEVFVDDELVHSKKTRNDGFLYNNAKQEIVVLDAIAAAKERRKNNKKQ
jgi:selT/selW/selH-like putative selenoprotein